MSIRKAKKQTNHALMRMSERLGLPSKDAKNFLKAASKKGLPPASFGFDTGFGSYLWTKSKLKRVRVYKGMIVIFNNTSDRAITAYKIPDEFLKEYEMTLKGLRTEEVKTKRV